VAIRAAHITLLDLREDDPPRPTARETGDSARLRRWLAVIKVEQQRIRFAAIDAGMLE
jgi:hypothetical protein